LSATALHGTQWAIQEAANPEKDMFVGLVDRMLIISMIVRLRTSDLLAEIGTVTRGVNMALRRR
jgi:hypothetical protein